MVQLGARLERDWLHEGLPPEKRLPHQGRGSILVGTENPDDAWTSTIVSSSRSGLRTGLLDSSTVSSSSGGESAEQHEVGWRLLWRDTGRRSAPTDYMAYVRVRTLGRGANGTAVLLRDKRSGDQVVCKELPLGSLEPTHLRELQNEVRILASLHHDHVIGYRCSFPRPQQQLLCVVMEYAEGGTLADVVKAHAGRDDEPIGEAHVARWLRELSSALAHLHAHRGQKRRPVRHQRVLQVRLRRRPLHLRRLSSLYGLGRVA